jgi:16S rRNA (cytosine1402-N4)-methyltransferase
MEEEIHIPVLPQEVLAYLTPQPGEVFLDGTLGMGGHSSLIAQALGPEGTIIGIDQDEKALSIAKAKLKDFPGKTLFFLGNFRYLEEYLEQEGISTVDGVLFDLGVSSLQLDTGERGFSYWQDAPLDMRMDQSSGLSAAEFINTAKKREIAEIIRVFGEERWASRIAEFIVEERKKKPIHTTGELVEVIKAAIPAAARRTGPHPARKTFQALRIHVNQELEALEEGLKAGIKRLSPGGRMAVISFHSLEDRVVKRVFQEKARACWCPPKLPVCVCGGQNQQVEILTSRPVLPQKTELDRNPRSRSAKLRALRKLV